MRPIPKSLLIHSCKATRTGELDPDGEPTESSEWVLNNVRIDATIGTQRLDVGETLKDTLTLFYDATNSASEPAGYIPTELDGIEWNGRKFTLRNIHILYTRGTDAVHHYEGDLV